VNQLPTVHGMNRFSVTYQPQRMKIKDSHLPIKQVITAYLNTVYSRSTQDYSRSTQGYLTFYYTKISFTFFEPRIVIYCNESQQNALTY